MSTSSSKRRGQKKPSSTRSWRATDCGPSPSKTPWLSSSSGLGPRAVTPETSVRIRLGALLVRLHVTSSRPSSTAPQRPFAAGWPNTDSCKTDIHAAGLVPALAATTRARNVRRPRTTLSASPFPCDRVCTSCSIPSRNIPKGIALLCTSEYIPCRYIGRQQCKRHENFGRWSSQQRRSSKQDAAGGAFRRKAALVLLRGRSRHGRLHLSRPRPHA
jgi:hypothetical protein